MSATRQTEALRGAELLGPRGREIGRAIGTAHQFLRSHSQSELLARVGETIDQVPTVEHLDKNVIQESYGGRREGAPNDTLTGYGLFFITEQRKLMLDCTAGHYQMTWGFHHPLLNEAAREGLDLGIVYDDHSNIPGPTVKRLAYKLIEICNPGDASVRACDDAALGHSERALNTVLLGIVTGSVACSTALKIMLGWHERHKTGSPVMVTLEGNYHGTDLFAQRMRHMWQPYFANVEFVNIEPNDIRAAEVVFAEYGPRIMGVMLEPIMMNREAILVEPEFAQRLRSLSEDAGALMAVDEIQTGFWSPEVFHYKRWGITPDFVICGKGMAAGFHPLSACVYRRPLDILAQYDSISTNGGAPLAAYVALQSIALIEAEDERLASVEAAYQSMMQEIAARFSATIKAPHGQGFLSGLKFHRVEDALEFHRRCVERGLWVRAHAYHEGHSTVLTKFALLLNEDVIEFTRGIFGELLSAME